MKTRVGVVLASMAIVAAGACASGGGGGGMEAPSTPEGEAIAQGETPRENAQTELASEQLSQASEAMEAGNEGEAMAAYEQALTAANQAIAQDSTNPLPYLQAGQAQMGLGDYQAADSLLSRAEELRPLYQFDIQPMRQQAWIDLYEQASPLVNQGQYEEAAEVLAKADAIYEERPEVKLLLGQIYAQLGRGEEAIPLLQDAMTMVEEVDREAYDSATIAGWEQQAEGLPPVLAQAYINAEQYENAAQVLRQLVNENPGEVSFARSLASLYIQLEQPDSASAIYDRILEQPELDPTTYYDVGIGLYQLEDYEAAAEAFEAGLEVAPRNRDAAEMWARALQLAYPPQTGQDSAAAPAPPEALDQLQAAAEAWLELDPYSRNAHVILAQTANRLDDQERAGELVSEIESLTVDMANLQFRPLPGGGAQINGTLRNVAAEAGTPVTLEFTFYGPDGTALGTESTTVDLPAQEATQTLQLSYEADTQVTGYTYTLEM